MIWKGINANNLPKGEVLARSEDGEMIIGRIEYLGDEIVCDDKYRIIIPTHYILKEDIKAPPSLAVGKIKKHFVELFTVEIGSDWAEIRIDGEDGKCRLNIVSSLGSWSYLWGSTGTDPISFLRRLDIFYLSNCFKENDEFRIDKTITMMKMEIIRARKDGDIDSDDTRGLWAEVEFLKGFSSFGSFENFFRFACPLLIDFFDQHPPVVQSISGKFERFFNLIWTPFINHI